VDSRKKSAAPAAASRTASQPIKAEADEDDGTVYRGYKTTSDGRKTTFFNNELDEQTKELIGDIAPKKLEEAAVAPIAAATEQGSAWNAAGTFESKDLTPWAKERLVSMLKSAQCSPNGAIIKVVEVTVTGDGEIVAARGKRKHIYDFTAEVQWSLMLTEGPGSAGVVKGELTIRDIDADEGGEYEVADVKVKGSPSKEQLAIVGSHVKAGSIGLQPQMFAQLDAFRKEFKAK